MKTYSTLDSIDFYGKHAVIINKISASNDDLQVDISSPPLFTRVLDSYFIAGLIGIINDYKGTIDKSSPEKKSIFTDTVNRHSPQIDFFAAIPIILKEDMSSVLEVKRAFFSESNEEENYLVRRNRIFYEYALGGLELIEENVLKSKSKGVDISEVAIFDRLEQYLSSLEKKFKIEDDFVDMDLIKNLTDLDI